MFLLLNEKQCVDTFLNLHVALRIYLCMVASKCPGERSFSHEKRIKNELRNTMGKHRASAFCLMSIKHNVLHSSDFKDFVNDFGICKARKRIF